tara:strand:- start:4732 stop:5181 length:450 start_codon:yes stop_codon:yes gene_type:complete
MNNKKDKKQGVGAFELGGVKFNGFHVDKLQSGGFFEDFGVIEWLMFSVVFIIIIVILLVLVNVLFDVNMDDIPLIGSITSLIGNSNPETSATPETPTASAASAVSPTSAPLEPPNNSTNIDQLNPPPPLKESLPNQQNGGKLKRYKNLR